MTTTLPPITKASAQTAVRDLVRKFHHDHQREAYNEQETREYFILPLFRALGWNTEDPAELSAEEQISRGRVDFGFYRHGVPVFYLETKRVSERLENPKFIRQAINYAYLRGVTWAVLCDFEQILVYNAQWDSNDLEKVRFLRLNYLDYAEKDFDDLWLLSKPAFMTNALDQKAEKYGKKAVREPVTQILFRQLTDWRKQLFTEFRTFGGVFATDSTRVDNAVQRLIDRLIFIRSMEDRGIEGDKLQSLTRLAKAQKKNLYAQLQARFIELDKQYNSNIFATSDLDHLKFSDVLLLDNIITGLYGNQTSIEYDFNAISADVLGAVYEQYLSFKAQDPHGEQTAKSHKRKSQGIYYTPQFIVRYIIQNTLGVALQNGADPLKIRVLDPACGSGSFLIEAFDYLDRWISRSHPDMPAPARRDHILQHNLYGVDLDEQATEVTRLNLLLRAAYERRLLPPLTHIKHGDSLIGSEFDYHAKFERVFADGGFDVVVGNPPYVRQETLGATFKDYVSKHYQVYAGTADLYVYFIERGLSLLKQDGRLGYITPNNWLRARYGNPIRQFLMKTGIESIVDFGILPIFADAVVLCSLLFLKNTPPNDTFSATNAQSFDMNTDLSEFVKNHENQIVRHQLRPEGWSLVGGQSLFTKLMATGTPLGEFIQGEIYRGVLSGLKDVFIVNQKTRNEIVAQNPNSAELFKPHLDGVEIRRYLTPIHQKYLLRFPKGWTRAQMAGEAVGTAFLPSAIQPSDNIGNTDAINRVPTNTLGAWNWLSSNYPAIAKYLEPFAERAQKRGDKGEFWWELRPCAYYDEFEKPKIMYPDIADRGHFILDTQNRYTDNTVYFITNLSLDDYHYLLGILNSELFTKLFSNVSSKLRAERLRWQKHYMEKMPIPTASETDRARLIGLVQKQLAYHHELAGLDITASDKRFELNESVNHTDAQINALVAGLYGVDERDVALLG